MQSPSIRNLEERVFHGLTKRPARHRRSLQKEIEVPLETAAHLSPPDENDGDKRKLNIVASGDKTGTWSREAMYGSDTGLRTSVVDTA